MKNPLIIFGLGDISKLAFHYFNIDSGYKVVGFTADSAYVSESVFCGLPVVPFDRIASRYSPATHSLFVALSYSKLNSVRKEKYFAGKALGYRLASYISTRASVMNEGQIGENCFILEDNTIQPFANIGNNVTLWSGNHIGHHVTISDHCFISSHVVISGGTVVREQCFLGVNCTLRDHITVGERCVLGAGTLLLSDAAPDGVYLGQATERSRVPSNRLFKI